MSLNFKKFIPHLIAFILFIVAAVAYFSPVLQNKVIFQSDIVQYQGMAKQLKEYRANGNEIYWTDTAFGGMPTYQLGAKYPYNFIKSLDLTLRFLPRPADYLFLYFIGLYVLLLVLKVDWKLAFIGALGFGFSTYLIIILGVGHNAKAHAIAYMPFVLSGIILAFRGAYFWGFVLTAVAMGLELVANHFQMTYYLLLLVICLGIAYLIDAIKKGLLAHYAKTIAVLMAAVIVAIGLNATNILATKEYADVSTRGKSELTINPDGTPKEQTEGLSYEYITEYSMGRLESMNIFIPRILGGGSGDPLPEDPETIDALLRQGIPQEQAMQILQQVPVYWGDQTFVSAPAYIGAVIMFLAVLALFLVKGRLKWWIVSGFFLSLLLSWGRNFVFLTEFFIDYIPLYSKFRAVSSIQVIMELVTPIIAMVGLHQLFNNFIPQEKKVKSLLWASGIVAGCTLLLIVAPSVMPGLDFASPYDKYFIEDLGYKFVEAMRADRETIFRADAIRSLIFVLIAATALWLFITKKIKELPIVVILGLLIVIDLVSIDKQYVNNDDFVKARIMEKPFSKNGATLQIEEDKSFYRVLDATTDPFNSATANYYHNALGGYHAAKPGRMNDLNDFYISKGNIGILNMMNVKYIMTQRDGGGPVAQRNPYANGAAWFVENVIFANNADEEIVNLDSLNTKKTAVIHKDFKQYVPTAAVVRDTLATIDLVKHEPEHIIYETSATSSQLTLFSEIYYPKGWNAYIDGKLTPHYRANYVLRAMTVPEGNHKVEFKFEPTVVKTGSTISLITAILLFFLVLGGGYFLYRKNTLQPAT